MGKIGVPEQLLCKPGELTEEEYAAVTMIRRHLITLPPADAMDKLLKMAEKFPSNAELFEKVRMVM